VNRREGQEASFSVVQSQLPAASPFFGYQAKPTRRLFQIVTGSHKKVSNWRTNIYDWEAVLHCSNYIEIATAYAAKKRGSLRRQLDGPTSSGLEWF
jgi:hypothetical protein